MRRKQRASYKIKDMFYRRLIISIPPWGMPVVILVFLVAALLPVRTIVLNAIAIGTTVTALVGLTEARYRVREFREEMHDHIADMLDAINSPIPEEPDLRSTEDDEATIIRLRK